MKIGILQCDDVQEQLQPAFGNYPQMFRDLMLRVDPQLEFAVYDVRLGELPVDIDECDAYITSGSRHGVLDGLAWVAELEGFVRRLDAGKKKFAGICFGHQLLARALGGEVEKSQRGWGVGVSFNQVDSRKAWMEPYKPAIDLVVSHQDQVSALPEGFEVLASSAFCPYYMLQYQDHMLSVQGHPEFSRDYSRALTLSRQNRIPPNRVREALHSLSAEVDDLLVMRWIINFFYDR
ncbi:GMP synthase [Marinobacterium aestuarii]|uniref:GMP synthase n=1 Tax=Marinobacterium aestuarii TaxID=1821621 RepID=A0A1A9ETX1_9GAMM|nr:GMP synthase [Marinobacterium aestuarii]ANG61307.1 GMP synthase [Marinobacterium aestuarii]